MLTGHGAACDKCIERAAADPPAPGPQQRAGPTVDGPDRELVSGLIWEDPGVVAAFVSAVEAERVAGDEIWDKGSAYRKAADDYGVMGLLRSDGYNRITEQLSALCEGTKVATSSGDQEPLRILRVRLYGLLGAVMHLRGLEDGKDPQVREGYR